MVGTKHFRLKWPSRVPRKASPDKIVSEELAYSLGFIHRSVFAAAANRMPVPDHGTY